MEPKLIRLSVLSNDELIGASLRGDCPRQARVTLETTASPAHIEATPFCSTDVVVIDLDIAGDLDFVTRLANRPDAPIVTVLAGQGLNGHTLEYTLLMAELRGASVCLPKPAAADEISAANVVVFDRRRTSIPTDRATAN